MKFEKITPVILNDEYFKEALKSKSSYVILEMGNFMTMCQLVKEIKSFNKEVFVKINEIQGIKEDDDVVFEYLIKAGVFGVVSNKTKVLQKAKKNFLKVVYTAFVFDTKSLDTTLKNIENIKPDIVEVRPGIMPKVIKVIREKNPSLPICATGIVTEDKEIDEALEAGAQSIVTSKLGLWKK